MDDATWVLIGVDRSGGRSTWRPCDRKASADCHRSGGGPLPCRPGRRRIVRRRFRRPGELSVRLGWAVSHRCARRAFSSRAGDCRGCRPLAGSTPPATIEGSAERSATTPGRSLSAKVPDRIGWAVDQLDVLGVQLGPRPDRDPAQLTAASHSDGSAGNGRCHTACGLAMTSRFRRGVAVNDKGHTPAVEPEDLGRFVVERANAGDVEGLVALYDPDAVLAFTPGQVVTGTQAIRDVYATFLAPRPTLPAGDQQPRSGAANSHSRPHASTRPQQPWRWLDVNPTARGSGSSTAEHLRLAGCGSTPDCGLSIGAPAGRRASRLGRVGYRSTGR